VLANFNQLVRQMDALRNDADPLLDHFVLTPNMLPPNAQDVPLLLSTREYPAMEAEEESARRDAAARPAPDAAALRRHNAMVDRLEAIFGAFTDDGVDGLFEPEQHKRARVAGPPS